MWLHGFCNALYQLILNKKQRAIISNTTWFYEWRCDIITTDYHKISLKFTANFFQNSCKFSANVNNLFQIFSAILLNEENQRCWSSILVTDLKRNIYNLKENISSIQNAIEGKTSLEISTQIEKICNVEDHSK